MVTPQSKLNVEAASCYEPRLISVPISALCFLYLKHLMDRDVFQKIECIWKGVLFIIQEKNHQRHL